MPETTQTPATTRSPATRRDSSPGSAVATTPDDGRGTTRIADSVVTKVAGLAAGEVSGVHALGGTSARAIGNVTQRVGIDTRSQGVSVEADEREASVEVTIVVDYGESIPDVTQEVREQIARRVEGICGLTVTKVDILVDDLHFAGDDDSDS